MASELEKLIAEQAKDDTYSISSPREVAWGMSSNIESLLERSLDPHRIHGIRGREIVAAKTAFCSWCDEAYTAKTRWQKYCSDACRLRAFRLRKKETHSD